MSYKSNQEDSLNGKFESGRADVPSRHRMGAHSLVSALRAGLFHVILAFDPLSLSMSWKRSEEDSLDSKLESDVPMSSRYGNGL